MILGFEGKRYRKTSFKTKRDATQATNKLLNDLTKGLITNNKITLTKYLNDWKEIYIKEYVSSKTYKNYCRYCEKVECYFKDKPLDKITRNEYQLFLTNFKDNLSQDQLSRLNKFILSRQLVRLFLMVLITKDFTFNVKVESSKPLLNKRVINFST